MPMPLPLPLRLPLLLAWVALLLVGFVLGLLGLSLGPALLRGRLFDRAWWTSTFVLATLHATDMPFYDSRINVAGWVLLAGIFCMARPPVPPAPVPLIPESPGVTPLP